MYLLFSPFYSAKFLKIFRAYPELWRAFSGQKWPIWPEQFFLVQTIIITFIYLLALFTVQNFKIFLQQIQSYEDVPFWVKNDPFAPFDPLEFFRKPVNEQGLI